MENSETPKLNSDSIKLIHEMLAKESVDNNKALIWISDIDGFKVYHVSIESAKVALTYQSLNEKANEQR